MSIAICNELARMAQQGDHNALVCLWEAVKGIASTVVSHYYETASIDSDDLLQHAFLAMLEAVKAYDSTRGDFKNIFIYHAKHSCGKALNLHRRGIEVVCSLDQPIGEDGESTMRDMFEDESLVSAQDQMELEELSDALRTALEALPERWRVVLIERYMYGHTLKAVGERLGCSYQNAARLEYQALKQLREDKTLAQMYRVP